MSLIINLRHLEHQNQSYQGELAAGALGVESLDEVIKVTQTIKYDLEAQKFESSILVQGCISMVLDCLCVRCLKPFSRPLVLNPWSCHLSTEGEEAVPLNGDCVDLTPHIREDIILAFPQHPVCGTECGGLKSLPSREKQTTGGTAREDANLSPWSVLDQLKIKE